MESYIVVVVSTTHYWKAADELAAKVNARVKEGYYVPLGGASISHRGDSHEVTMAQAMVKRSLK